MTPSVLHLSTYASGGAGRAARSLHEAMLAQGVDSALWTAHGAKAALASRIDKATVRLQKSPWVTWRSAARMASLNAAAINRSTADIVNLHWVTDGLLSVEEIGKITKPLVWTMHDMWPFTGTEHYAAEHASDGGPHRWEVGYTKANRPSDESGPDIDRWTWERKARHWANGCHLVPVSTWLQRMAARSSLAGTWPSTPIPNVMPLDRFRPLDQRAAREAAGLPLDRPLIAFTASAGITDERKGWKYLRDALPEVARRHPDVGIIVIGPHLGEDPHVTAPIYWQGVIEDDDRMAQLINAADVVAVPSIADNLPMTACEAHASGRPVVAFDVGGLPDIVQHHATGYLARPYETDDLAVGLCEAIEDSRGARFWAGAARQRAESLWSARVVVDQYIRLYEGLLR